MQKKEMNTPINSRLFRKIKERERLVSSNSIELRHRLGGEGTSVGEFAHLIRHYLDISAAVGLLGRLVLEILTQHVKISVFF